jgi:hypothetical protein
VPVVAAAVCPHPPLLVPEVASGAAPDLDDLRAACLTAIDQLSTASRVLVVGAAVARSSYPAGAGGSFGPYGAPGVRIGTGDPVLPLSLAVGGWLLEQTKAAQLPRAYVAVPVDATPAECRDLGEELAEGNDRIGLLVMATARPGAASTRRSTCTREPRSSTPQSQPPCGTGISTY